MKVTETSFGGDPTGLAEAVHLHREFKKGSMAERLWFKYEAMEDFPALRI